jgi:hypothetical protein
MSREAELAELEARARKLAHAIGNGLPKGVGFVVWLFEFGKDGWATYVSNAQRDDMIKALEELLTKLRTLGEIRPPIAGGRS